MFSAGSYAKVWEIKRLQDKYADMRISTSHKNESGDYEQDFSGFVRLVGKARKDAEYVHENDTIKIVRCGVTNKYDKEKKVTYTNFTIFEIEVQDEKNEKSDDLSDNPFLTE